MRTIFYYYYNYVINGLQLPPHCIRYKICVFFHFLVKKRLIANFINTINRSHGEFIDIKNEYIYCTLHNVI